MDAQAKKKALYRAKLNAQKLEKRIESPLVRYNEYDQPVCRICDVVLKSESLWPAHQASRKHHEAVNNVKANAASLTRVKKTSTELHTPKPEHSMESHNNKPEPSPGMPKPRPSSSLPPDFFDNHETKRQKNGTDVAKLGDPDPNKKAWGPSQTQTRVMEALGAENKIDGLSGANVARTQSYEIQPLKENAHASEMIVGSETKQVKGSLPEGFFDDKNADLRARGITPVKLDVKDEYKEYEKLIQEDLQEVDKRFEEEEFDAAETIEEAETVEQRACREKVEILKRKKIELKAARSAMHSKHPQIVSKESSHEESSSDDSDDDFRVDWRAKHL